MTPEEYANNTFQMSLDRAGTDHQLLKTAEECSELIHAIMKAHFTNDIVTDSILEEMAHVELCIECLKYRYKQLPASVNTVLDRYNIIKDKRLEDWHELEALEEYKRRYREYAKETKERVSNLHRMILSSGMIDKFDLDVDPNEDPVKYYRVDDYALLCGEIVRFCNEQIKLLDDKRDKKDNAPYRTVKGCIAASGL